MTWLIDVVKYAVLWIFALGLSFHVGQIWVMVMERGFIYIILTVLALATATKYYFVAKEEYDRNGGNDR
jgi:hypothetical protein